jgi:hypothetical protein
VNLLAITRKSGDIPVIVPSVYDTDNNGIVDNSEKIGNLSLADLDGRYADKVIFDLANTELTQAKDTAPTLRGKIARLGVDAAQYGCIGDDATENITFMNDAITNTPDGGILYFPTGIYRYTPPLNIPKSIRMVGIGKVIFKPTVLNIAVQTSVDDLDGIRVDNIVLDGSIIVLPGDVCFKFNKATNLKINDCKVINTPRTAMVLQKCSDFEIKGCKFDNIGTAHQVVNTVNQGTAIHVQNCNQGSVHHNYFHEIWQLAVFAQSTDGYCEKISVHHNNVDTCHDNGIRFQPDIQVGSGLVEWDKVRNCDASFNKIINVTIDSIRLNGIYNSAIGNEIKASGSMGVRSSGGYGHIVAKNKIDSCSLGIQFYVQDNDLHEIDVEGNVITNSTSATSGGIQVVRMDAAKKIYSLTFRGNTSNSNAGLGMEINNAYDVTLIGNKSKLNGKDGIALLNCNSVSLTANESINNAQTTAGKVGIWLYAVADANLSTNRAYDNQATKTQAYGLKLENATTANVYAMNNNFKGNLTGAINIGAETQVGTHVIKDNLVA